METMKYEKGPLVHEGKTKWVYEVIGHPDLVWMEYKNEITMNDDPSLTKRFKTKAMYSNTVNSYTCALLKKGGIRVAWVEQVSPTAFIAEKCSMIGVEFIGRRRKTGSERKRNPDIEDMVRSPKVVTQVFIKTTKGKLINSQGKLLISGLDPKKGEEDPYVLDPLNENWTYYHPKKPVWLPDAKLGSIHRSDIIGDLDIVDSLNFVRDIFLVLEGAYNKLLGYLFVDVKFEFGINSKDELLLGDVVDPDSYRLRFNGEKFSKEAFRQGEALSEVERKYGIVAQLVQQWRIPNQALVLWRGSEKDSFPEVGQELMNMPGLTIEKITLSGHKSTQQTLDLLNWLVGKYPDGGTIIVKVGMSNGLGPILASHTSWPVINIPATLKSFPQDIWSSVRMPSNVPCATINRDQNAILFALNILAMKNPLVYAFRQKQIEKLDY